MDKRALAVGINDYPRRPLRACEHDAREMAAALELQEYSFSVSLLLGSRATRLSIMKALRELFSQPAETYVFYFAGHGVVSGVSVYLMSFDGHIDEAGVDLDFLRRLLTDMTPKESNVVVILDCCHSGAAEHRGDTSDLPIMTPVELDRITRGLPASRAVLAACSSEQYAFENYDSTHGIFTQFLLQGLTGEAADAHGDVTVPGLFDYVSSCLSNIKPEQTPILKGEFRGRFVLGRNVAPKRPMLPEQEGRDIEQQAEFYLSNYQSEIQPFEINRDQWDRVGYQAACRELEPIIRWFDDNSQSNPVLLKRSRYFGLREDALHRLAKLADLHDGMVTSSGTVKNLLGWGNFGYVWKVVDARLNHALAYKVYHGSEIQNLEKIARFRQGYQAMKKLDHPFIVKVLAFSECPIGFFMDYIDGPNLMEFAGGMDGAAEKVRVLHAIAKTLQYAHQREVVHRDVKPQNIVMQLNPATQEWEPFLMDFDLAWYPMAKGQLTLAGGKGMGTLNYSAPEQLQGGHPTEVRAKTTDSYAFGQLCYFVIANEDPKPYAASQNALQLRKRIRDSFYAEPSRLFVELYEKCSQTDPRGRPLFDEIAASLAFVSQLLGAIGTMPIIEERQFMDEILFGMLVSPEQGKLGDHSFLTQSGRFRIAIEIRDRSKGRVDLIFDFWAQQRPASAVSYKKATQSILARLGSALTKQKAKNAITMRNGSAAPFQVFLDYANVPLNIVGVKEITDFLQRMIEIADDF